ncbi:hypothetical protein ACG0Z6_05310 [Roseateles sp. BYS180W]|uniref:GlcNAc-PI de-N-acetylase n=1 Tax=Roseateles rivi TaxID=3299028 RepID=A0ABW7FTK8_9BURK
MRTSTLGLALALLATTVPAATAAPSQNSVYAAAHPDDFALFMGKNLMDDAVAKTPFVMILGTAGDSGYGRGVGSNIYNKSYADVRVTAHIQSLRFLMSMAPGSQVPQTNQTSEVHAGKRVTVYKIGEVKVYTLMLPDGNGDGSGFRGTNNESVTRLRSGAVSSIKSLDGRNTSYTLAELKATLASIIKTSMKGTGTVWLNVSDDAHGTNPDDHADHRDFSKTVQDAMSSENCINKALYKGYAAARGSANQNKNTTNNRMGYWGALNAYLINDGNPTTFDSEHDYWIDRQFFRESWGAGGCRF